MFEEFLDAKQEAIVKTIGGGSSVKGAIRARATARRIRRSITNTFNERPHGVIPPRLLAFKRKESTLVDSLCPDRAKLWLGPFERSKKGAQVEVELRDFSFVDDPDGTLDSIGRLLRAETGAWDIRVHFDDDHCLDIAPYLVLAMGWRDLAPIFTGGRMGREIQRVVEAVQLRRPLRMGRFRMDFADHYNVHAFPLHQRRPANTSRSQTRHLDPQARERVQDGLVRSMNQWLDHPKLNMELTKSGRANIKNIVGEILDNAERHSMPTTMDGDWTIAGFMARRIPSLEGGFTAAGIGDEDAAGEFFQCSIAFVSIGTPISESLDTSPPAVAAEVDQYVNRHLHHCDVDVLKTIMSIQDGITRVAESLEAGRGGTGFQDVFDLVQDLGTPHIAGCEPKVTIVSGNACLKLHAPYAVGARAANDRFAPRQIWFNGANDSLEPPDGRYAFRLKKFFPGTLVTMSFVFTPDPIDGDKDGSN